MVQSLGLPPLDPFPDDIEDHVERLLQDPGDPAIGDWLLELIKYSGHKSTSDDLRWRVLCVVWLACEYDTDKAWPYLMWLNLGEPALSPHLSDILIEAIDSFDAHVRMANWLANATDERIITFFKEFQVIPTQRKIRVLVTKLFDKPTQPEVGVWLATFCEDTADLDSEAMRPWRLLTAAWYAACFNPTAGLGYLHTLTNGADTLSKADLRLLTETAGDVNGLAPMIQLIAACPDPEVKNMLKDFGHPDLPEMVETLLQRPPDYAHLANSAAQASLDAETVKRNLACLEEAGLSSTAAHILDLACGPLSPHTLILTSVGYNTVGVDLHIPPGYLPLAGVKQWFRRIQHVKAWKRATGSYYEILARNVAVKLNWRKVNIELADLTRLNAADNSFDAVICANHLQHSPDVHGLLAEAARVLKPGGLFLADIRPYAALQGAFQSASKIPWSHLNEDEPEPFASTVSLNKWREIQFRNALELYFGLEQWLPETDVDAQTQLTAEIRAKLANYSEAELTRRLIVVIARKAS